jgi:aspartate oxidase
MADRADFVVVGSGIAGLTFALTVAEHGSVIVVTKKDDAESATNMVRSTRCRHADGGRRALQP